MVLYFRLTYQGFSKHLHTYFSPLIFKSPCLFKPSSIYEVFIKGTVIQIEKALTNDRLRISKVS